MKHVLITGFEPFGNDSINASMETANRLARWSNDACYVSVREIPTVFDESIERLKEAIEATRPDVIICLGQANGVRHVNVERVALNINDARIPDNRGKQPVDEYTVEGGPAAYWSTLPVRRIVRTLQNHDIPSRLSESAGTFVCNHLFYGLMDELSRRNKRQQESSIIGGFIHLPRLPQQVDKQGKEPSLEIERAVEAVQLAVETAVEKLENHMV